MPKWKGPFQSFHLLSIQSLVVGIELALAVKRKFYGETHLTEFSVKAAGR